LGRDCMPVLFGVNVQMTKRVGLHVMGESILFHNNGASYGAMIGLDCAL